MKKRLLALALLPLTMGVLASCGHTHTFASEWTTNEEQHWHAATCEHKDEKGNLGNHTFGEDNFCTVCGYQKTTVDDYKMTKDEWNKFWTANYIYYIAENYKFTMTASFKNNTSVGSVAYIDSTKLQIDQIQNNQVTDSMFAQRESTDFTIYEKNPVSKNYEVRLTKDNPMDDLKNILSGYFDYDSFTFDEATRSYKRASATVKDAGELKNLSITFLRKKAVNYSFEGKVMDFSEKESDAVIAGEFTYGGQTVTLPDVPFDPESKYKVDDYAYEGAFGHRPDPLPYPISENVTCTLTLGGDAEPTIETFEVDGNKAREEINNTETFFEYDGEQYYRYFKEDQQFGNWKKEVVQVSATVPQLRTYYNLFGSSDFYYQLTYNEKIHAYTKDKVENGDEIFTNIAIFFENSVLLKITYTFENRSVRMPCDCVAAFNNYGSTEITLPEVSPEPSYPEGTKYIASFDGQSYLIFAENLELAQFEITKVELGEGQSFLVKNVTTKPETPLTDLRIEGNKCGFTLVNGVLTPDHESIYSFYLKPDIDDGVIYIVDENDVPGSTFQLLVGEVAVNLQNNPTPQDPSFTEWFVTGLDVETDTIIRFRDNSKTPAVDFDITTIDPASVANFSIVDGSIKCTESGTYDFYLKLKMYADQVYIGESK